jgi:hypothetical protein
MDAEKGEIPRTTTPDARSVNAETALETGNNGVERLNYSIQESRRCGTQTTERRPISKTHQPNQPPKKVRQICTEQLKSINDQADHLVFRMIDPTVDPTVSSWYIYAQHKSGKSKARRRAILREELTVRKLYKNLRHH